ncbi:MAG: cytochrome c oxidase subunit 3 [Gammaproteobacteria bacterium]|nr:cytochrome c oxidase subunit 3 [Gammaproteobacteria bacterium]
MSQAQGSYYLPEPSHWPLVGSVGLITLLAGFAHFLHGGTPVFMYVGAAILLFMMFGWFSKVVGESERGLYNEQVDRSFRWGMSWFIFSEVMFFAAFFGALFYVRHFAVPWLGGEGAKGAAHELWGNFQATWPLLHTPLEAIKPDQTDFATPHSVMDTWGIPAINTLILLSSGVTVTWAHWGLKKNNRGQLILGLILTVALGVLFLALQAHEYGEAYEHFNMKLTSGVYGSTFFMLTGFHGLHVTIGAIMLTVMLIRSIKGHFTPKHHFAFEAAAWYWHFVDVVWLGLFIFVYWL